ncbi:hypothetical protein [Methylobacterium sp. J-068]|uniref:hypothetical protein n=1 Tax=Methylobacterium sp. J-068 TaxID=2836649 RepID=UPI001FBBDF20|nr:hypothetical protein [Methylobacterium sp. J-068]MCJ2037050.1 hypothetical protein [Methylobacterium sp. J-068]
MSTSLTRKTLRNTLAAALVLGLSGAALARGGGSGGDGLSPYAALSGNDRSAGVNNGNYRDPRLDPYLGAYEGRYDRPVRERYRPSRQPYYGYPY